MAVVLSVTALQEGPQQLKELLTISSSDHYPQSVSFCAIANPYGVLLTPKNVVVFFFIDKHLSSFLGCRGVVV